ncbi:MAG: PBECR2 nuclease fold domain-containing protein [Clostridia bacterium]|nr:PBECR2 nuclease fold domain-containing protein [Clostridia bacterium]
MEIKPSQALPQCVGNLSQEVISRLGLHYGSGPIYIGPSNVEHIRCKHPVEFVKHLQDIPDIIENPDYIAVHPRQGGVEFVRMFEENGVMVSVRPSAKGTLFVRSIYAVTDERVQSYLQKGTLIRFEEEC